MARSQRTCLIALGANQARGTDDLAQALRSAARRLQELTGADLSLSRLFRTPCFPPGAGPDYLNAAARLEHGITPSALLEMLHRIEAEFGRERVQRWGQRTLDLDLIACGDTVLPDAATQAHWRDLPVSAQIGRTPQQLILPHPRLQDRAFVLVPLAEVAAGWVHPVLGLTVMQMLARLPTEERAEIVPI